MMEVSKGKNSDGSFIPFSGLMAWSLCLSLQCVWFFIKNFKSSFK